MSIKIVHPIEYSNLVENKIISHPFWHISSFLEVMVVDKNNSNHDIFNYFYCLFFPIFAETFIEEEKIEYFDIKIYLINHSRNKKNITLTFNKTSKIIYFVNNSNAKFEFKNETINLDDKKGSSIFVEEIDKIEVIRSNNIQTCIVVLDLKNKINKDFKYK